MAPGCVTFLLLSFGDRLWEGINPHSGIQLGSPSLVKRQLILPLMHMHFLYFGAVNVI